MATSVSPHPGSESLMTSAEVGAVFGVSARAVREWGEARKLTVSRTLGGHRRYRESEVLALAASLTVEAETHAEAVA